MVVIVTMGVSAMAVVFASIPLAFMAVGLAVVASTIAVRVHQRDMADRATVARILERMDELDQ